MTSSFTGAPTYPGSAEITVDALLQQPQIILREITRLAYKRLIADRILMRGSAEQVQGGAVWYQRSESIYPNRDVEQIGNRAGFPRAGWTEDLFSTFVDEFGLEIPIDYKAIRRKQVDLVARSTIKLANGLTKFVDSMAMTMILTDADVPHIDAEAPWDDPGANIIGDLTLANSEIEDEDENYEADTLIVASAANRRLLLDEDIRNALPRETDRSAIQTGRPSKILGYDDILVSPALKAIAPTAAIVLQKKVIGSIADERPDPTEKYRAYTPQSAEEMQWPPTYVKVYDEDKTDDRIVRCARWPAMWLAEPKAARVIDGVFEETT